MNHLLVRWCRALFLHQGSFCHTEFFKGLNIIEELGGSGVAGEEILVGVDRLLRCGFVVVEQFHAEARDAGVAELIEITGAGLRAAVEESVAATDVGLESVKLADAVFQMDHMFFAWTSAVFVGRALAEEDAEHAVLHVKHRHVLVERDLKPFGWCRMEEVEHLADVEVVGNREVIECGFLHQLLGRDGVGDVE